MKAAAHRLALCIALCAIVALAGSYVSRALDEAQAASSSGGSMLPGGGGAALVCDTADALGDPDGDGIASGYEAEIETDPCAYDTDGDNCLDGNEIWHDRSFGGERRPKERDFFDANDNALIDLQDTLVVLGHFGLAHDAPGAARFDRKISDPSKPWRAEEDNDGIDLEDALVSLQSFGHDCGRAMLNPECPDGLTGVKFDSPFSEGTMGPITVTQVVEEGGEPKYFDWTSTVGVSFVYVKASTEYLTYSYDPPSFGDTTLTAPEGPSGPRGISHVLFCFDGSAATATPSPSPTQTNTPVNTPTRTNTPVNTPTRTNTPVNTPTRTNTPVNTPTRTNTPVNTPTRTNTPVNTPTYTQTNVVASTTQSPPETPTPPVNTPTRTNTPVNTPTRTNTPVNTPTRTNTPVNTPTRTKTPLASPTHTNTPVPPCEETTPPETPRNGLVKSIDCQLPVGETILTNLWVCYDQSDDNIDNNGDSTVDNETPTCLNNGEGVLHVEERIFSLVDCDTRNDDDDGDGKPVSNDPGSPGYRPECPAPTIEDFALNLVDKDGGELPEGLGAFEFQLKFDHKVFDIVINTSDEWANGRPINCGMTVITENDIRFACVTSGPILGLPQAYGQVGAHVWIYPEPDMRYRIRASKDNGVLRKILDENCEIADIYGDIFPGTNAGLTPDCSDLDITVRRLEGDVDIDCDVDLIDQQLMNYRFQAFFGSLLYDPAYDLEPWPWGDYDIDIKDLQFVNGRVGSTCAHPIPDNQDPLPAYIVALP